ncbi:DUF4907 domain-containing protein [Chitinophaga oryzae]|uniref:DUF4907 domain-containing protein n=1 Tax=Chitinophaga oryzae TaxID=2725414 RepID=A0AAE6ZIN7_9BACT|nr:DUF4907 domain-containing protein [Chitinophaga oryzae]QJB33419.1 DUF4907 domain-containing protein [Chitinophaga oryzae]QJB39938.1 DUF4907 domain-containing protein [Chitinophaga oryzae]
MTKRKLIWAVPVALLLLLAAYRRHLYSSQDADMVQLTVVPFETAGGWGYRVMVDHRSFICQDVIPGIAGNRPFRTKEDAQKVGQAVVEKLMARQRPTMTLTELIKMQVAGVQ